MATLINRIQRAFLGSAGEEKVRALLVELAIPAGGSGGSIRDCRRGFLRPISDEAILRDALANLGLTGGGSGARPISNIRTAILHNLHDSETVLRNGLNDLLAPGDLGDGGGEEGGEGPEWVPVNANIHIDFLGGDPQGRAWVQGTGEVAMETLLGADANVDNAWGAESGYNSANLIADGYVGVVETVVAYLGAARTKLLASATVRMVYKNLIGSKSFFPLILASEDGGDAVTVQTSGENLTIGSYGGAVDGSAPGLIIDTTSINAIAFTITNVRFEAACNGNASVLATTLDEFDRPPGNPMVSAFFDYSAGGGALQAITIYDPLPDTTGLSELSEP